MANLAGESVIQNDAGWVPGASDTIRIVEGMVAEIAPTNLPILLVGESGTGKEVFANRIYQLSRQSERPLARISCASMKSATFSAELGFDSRTRRDHNGNEPGTVFLDEIGELDAACQRDLLCALPDGGAMPGRGILNARLISTTSRNMDEEMRAGRFRGELYYRISCVCLRLPPLRERKEDIAALADFFLKKHAAELSRPRPSLRPETLQVFVNYPWPGNIRELENVVREIVVLGDETLAVAELGTSARKRTPAPALGSYSLKAASRAASREAERELIMQALARTRWNRKRAAQELQISYKSLLYKLKQIGFQDSEVN
ncbi:MAG TPA: sigma 54-interacting transcriptional regulator [Candidatus Acidoferrales bacterium]|nr:sigma 54-interacting transcriptional regulator [Candidatus Acidoferrales bacterium]